MHGAQQGFVISKEVYGCPKSFGCRIGAEICVDADRPLVPLCDATAHHRRYWYLKGEQALDSLCHAHQICIILCLAFVPHFMMCKIMQPTLHARILRACRLM